MIVAHGLGGVKDLPIPGWMFLWGAAVVLVLSFLAFGILWRRPVLELKSAGRPLPKRLSAVLTSRPLEILLGAISVGLLVLVFLAAAVGDTNVLENLAPTFVYVVFWLGLVLLSVVFGNVWRVLNPWRASARGVAWLWSRLGFSWETLDYPERLGRWPAAFMLFAFVALELTYIEPASPRALALAIAFYSYATWLAMAAFGIEKWCERGEGFSVYFGFLSRIAPFARRGRDIVVRAPFSGLAGAERLPGTLAFIATMLGSVAFDGISRGRWWTDLNIEVSVESGESLAWLMRGAGLLAAIALVALVYSAATWVSARSVGARRSLVLEFVRSLIPIALVYAIAHYLSLFVNQIRYAWPLASDPFGRNWDLFGTANSQPPLTVWEPNTVWYLQVAALIIGHVAGLAVAHDRALVIFRKTSDALRSQYPMLALMVVYTVGGLYLLAQN